MKIAIAQLDPVVGDFEGNFNKISDAYQRACQDGARVMIAPELCVFGYPPMDLAASLEMIEHSDRAVVRLAALTRGKSTALIVGHMKKNPSPTGRPAFNQISVLEDGERVAEQAKSLLPTYDVFDEARYFEPATEIRPWICDGKKISLAICEDLWASDSVYGKHIYERDPVAVHQKLKPDLILSISSSPYQIGKRSRREKIHGEIAKKLGVPLIYVNQSSATDEILFDGTSFGCDSIGDVCFRFPSFKDFYGGVEVEWGKGVRCPDLPKMHSPADEMETLFEALTFGVKSYFARTGFSRAVLGLSGGIDSALVAVIAVRALGASNVLGVAMPGPFSSSHSLEDAEVLARNLGIRLETVPIKFAYATLAREWGQSRGGLSGLALENLQARLRGMVLMTLSNHSGDLVLTTGNKSELAVGYCTQYGDMAGALAPIGDLFKTRVYELAHWVNKKWVGVIPERSIRKAPSAELRADQTDQDTLPPYSELDEALAAWLEDGMSREVFARSYRWGAEILKRVDASEFKRRQAAPVLKVTAKAFGIGRRVPIAARFRMLS